MRLETLDIDARILEIEVHQLGTDILDVGIGVDDDADVQRGVGVLCAQGVFDTPRGGRRHRGGSYHGGADAARAEALENTALNEQAQYPDGDGVGGFVGGICQDAPPRLNVCLGAVPREL